MAPKREKKVKVEGDSAAAMSCRGYIGDAGITAESMIDIPQSMRSACYGAMNIFNKKNPDHELAKLAAEATTDLMRMTVLARYVMDAGQGKPLLPHRYYCNESEGGPVQKTMGRLVTDR